jgi:hypothetical protein
MLCVSHFLEIYVHLMVRLCEDRTVPLAHRDASEGFSHFYIQKPFSLKEIPELGLTDTGWPGRVGGGGAEHPNPQLAIFLCIFFAYMYQQIRILLCVCVLGVRRMASLRVFQHQFTLQFDRVSVTPLTSIQRYLSF